ncbi:MAG: hypothetical protein WC358_04225 [Ignavibacteria bacterium]|jgi:hypothetical protein
MNKLIIIVTIFISGLPIYIFPQDSILNKPIVTNKFDLTVKYTEAEISFPMLNESNNFEKVYKDCNKITPITDSSFYVNSNTEKVIILYKDINDISFKGKNKKGDGIFLGLLGGLVSSFVTCGLILSNSSGDGDKNMGNAIIVSIIFPTITAIGTTTGWIIGANTYERENYDLTKFSEQKKKEEILRIFKKHKIYF